MVQIKGKKKNHLSKLKVDVGEFAHNGSTTKKEIVFANGKSSKSAKDEGPILTVSLSSTYTHTAVWL
jgi:hypothetical protein